MTGKPLFSGACLLKLSSFTVGIVVSFTATYCADERVLPNGFVTYSVGSFYSQTQLVSGVTKRFHCHRGWTLVGASTSRCSRGRWSTRTPRCVPGIKTSHLFVKGSWATVYCYLESACGLVEQCRTPGR